MTTDTQQRTFPTAGVIADTPTSGTDLRRVLVTEAPTRDNMVGQVVSVTDTNGNWWVTGGPGTDSGWWVRGALLNQPVREGERLLAIRVINVTASEGHLATAVRNSGGNVAVRFDEEFPSDIGGSARREWTVHEWVKVSTPVTAATTTAAAAFDPTQPEPGRSVSIAVEYRDPTPWGFAVGDWVREPQQGHTARVIGGERAGYTGSMSVYLWDLDRHVAQWRNHTELERIDAPPETVTPVNPGSTDDFAVGDAVEVHGYGPGGDSPWNGPATVRRISGSLYEVQRDNDGRPFAGLTGGFNRQYLRRRTPALFRAGQQVRVAPESNRDERIPTFFDGLGPWECEVVTDQPSTTGWVSVRGGGRDHQSVNPVHVSLIEDQPRPWQVGDRVNNIQHPTVDLNGAVAEVIRVEAGMTDWAGHTSPTGTRIRVVEGRAALISNEYMRHTGMDLVTEPEPEPVVTPVPGVFEVGQRVIVSAEAKRPDAVCRVYYDGNGPWEGTVLRGSDPGNPDTNLRVEVNGHGQYVAPRYVTHADPVQPPQPVEQVHQDVARLTRELEAAQRNLRALQSQWDRLATGLQEKAEQHDWCSEYDDFAEEHGLPRRTQEWDVDVIVNLTTHVSAGDLDSALGSVLMPSGYASDVDVQEGVDVSHRVTLTFTGIEASDASDAENLVDDMIADRLSSDGYQYEDYSVESYDTTES